MKYANRSVLISTLFILIVSNSAFGQKTEPLKRVIEPDHVVPSKIMGKDYQLYISFPRGYSNKDTISYPVLYVLDGGTVAFFEAMHLAHKYLGYSNGIEKVILVGIESGTNTVSWHINRLFDYTPSSDTVVDRNADKERNQPRGTFRSGGAAKFLECLKSEIIPFVDQHYKTTNDRGIAGHSLGGLFATWCFINSPGFFTRYAINSPSLSWNKDEVLNQAIEKFKETKTWNVPQTKVFISAGGLEGPLMLPGMIKLSTELESKSYPNIDLTWKIFDDETHLSIVPAMMSRSISVLYGKNEKK